MRFDKEKKMSIILYLLDKISKKSENISKQVTETFGVNQSTVHSYINELVKDGVLKKIKRGEYELIKNKYEFCLSRSDGHLDSDTYAYNACLKQYISHLPANVQTIWSYSFSEMINNVMDHSDADTALIEIEQDYLNTTAYIADNGVGIFEKIKNHFGFETLDDAICELFKGKLTTDPSKHSGEGIFFSSKIMDDFAIVSDRKIFTVNKFDESMIMNLASQIKCGTCVRMSLSNHTHKQTYEIFDLFSNVDGGFTKTTIPLKNIFDTAPVSRSQARRVCNRLDKFKEVVLDFDSLDWMGQAFAHQIFVLYANEHPEIKLIPVNMNEAITKMYNHAINS